MMISFKDFFYRHLSESFDPDVDVYDNEKEDPSEWLYKNNYKKLFRRNIYHIGFILHYPTSNIYFFSRDAHLHNDAMWILGFSSTDDLISGTYDASPRTKQTRNQASIHISLWSSDKKILTQNFINTEFKDIMYNKAYITVNSDNLSIGGEGIDSLPEQ